MTKPTDKKKNVTSQMIADLANVSRATVSRVMKNDPYVKDSVRRRVQKIIDEYDYKPNYAGTALVRQRRQVKIGIVGLNAQNPLYNEIRKGARKAAEEHKGMGVDILFRNTEDITQGSEIAGAIHELVQKDVQGLALLGTDDPAVQQAVREIQEKIPVVTFNTNISSIKEFCFVGQDSHKSGRTAGALMAELLPAGRVAVIANSLKVLAVAKRISGFEKKLKETGRDIRISGIYENDSSDEISYDMVRKLCAQPQQLDGIYIASGFGSGGVCRALEECGREDVRIIAHDMLPDTIELVKKGHIAFTIGQELKRQGYLPIDILAKYLLMSERPKTRKIYTKIDIFNAENI